MLVDSGTTTKVVDENTWEDLKLNKMKCISRKSTSQLRAYASDKPLDVKGNFNCKVVAGNRPMLTLRLNVLCIGYDINVVSEQGEGMRRQYPEVCNGNIGKLNDREVTIHRKSDMKPVACHVKRQSSHIRPKRENRISQLLEKDIIEPVEGPKPWLNPVVVMPKADVDVWICLDMHEANTSIERGRYPIPTVEQGLENMNRAMIFSMLNWGYHQLELEPESRDITAFATHSGLYRCKHSIVGVTSASKQY